MSNKLNLKSTLKKKNLDTAIDIKRTMDISQEILVNSTINEQVKEQFIKQTFELNSGLHKTMKLHCLNHGISIKDYLGNLIEKDLLGLND